MEEIRTFDNQEFGEIRAVRDGDGAPWFVAKDVAIILGYRDASQLTRLLDTDEKGTQLVRTPGGMQELSTINEGGFYKAVMQRRASYVNDPDNQAAIKSFQHWVTHEVLPALRRDGAYVASDGTEDDATLMARALLAAKRTIASRDERIARQQARIGALEPKAGYFDACMDGERWSSFTEAARLLRQYDGGMTRKRLFELAQADGIITRDKQASRVGIDRGYVRNYQPPAYFDQVTGEMVRPRPYAKVTGKGLSWMVRRYCKGAVA
ncbi:BRO family protein [Olsenella profusa]|uniref:BRO family, N-terminal domain protein n=1 Tax=Olsenella profusa F0195 TaxID=1125712 RepID=U2TPG4_9ACTN|nr:BRO family protein [Olsenella profusa]ERL08018.1 BRO family, N-terminal domain protein [Olsenella profusa F0195]